MESFALGIEAENIQWTVWGDHERTSCWTIKITAVWLRPETFGLCTKSI